MDNKISKLQKKLESSLSSKKKNGSKNIIMKKLDSWLLKKGIISDVKAENKKDIVLNSSMSEKNQDFKENKKSQSKKVQKSTHISKQEKRLIKQNGIPKNHIRQSVIESFISKEQIKSKSKSIRKTSSNESCDLPSFKTHKAIPRGNKLYKKYGIMLPSVEEVLQEKKDLEVYKNQLEAFQDIKDVNMLSLPFKNKETYSEQPENILDCKDLPFQKISKAVRNNLEYLKDIMYERVYNERHERFNDKYKKPLTLITKDLTYNNSMILFTYDQTEYMITKLKKYLDPEDNLTQYFFQVLLPELCLKIFMETHDMNYEDAVIYLDSRPLTETF